LGKRLRTALKSKGLLVYKHFRVDRDEKRECRLCQHSQKMTPNSEFVDGSLKNGTTTKWGKVTSSIDLIAMMSKLQ